MVEPLFYLEKHFMRPKSIALRSSMEDREWDAGACFEQPLDLEHGAL